MEIEAHVEVVWRLLTAERGAWWPEMRFESIVGSPLVETWTEDGDQADATGRVTRCDEPHLLAFRWTEQRRGDPLEVEIELVGRG